jgi:hypothetical protein
MALIGAAAGIAGCSGPVQSLIVPNADAARAVGKGVTGDVVSAHWLRLHHLRVNASFDIYLIPKNANYWTATNTAPHVAVVNEANLNNRYFDVFVVGRGSADIMLTGKGGESLSIYIGVS